MRTPYLSHTGDVRKELGVTLLLLLLTVPPSPGQQGRIVNGTITSSALKTNLYRDPYIRNYRVYLPPSYDASLKRYPVVYALHGYLNDENQLSNGGTTDYGVAKGLKAALDKMIRQRSIGEMIVIFPNANNWLFGSFYLSSPVIGDYETYLVKELVTLIDNRYRTLTNRENRGVTGYSMGGWGTMHLALKFPEVFSVAVPEAGRYNSRCPQSDADARQLARFHPTNYNQFMAMGNTAEGVWLCAHQALFAGLLPNPQRPSLYTDYPYEWVNGQIVTNAAADLRCREGDVLNGDLPRYLLQPVRLNGIKIVHGRADPSSPVVNAREFTNALSTAGIDFEYEEHSGRHDYLPELALPFLSSYLCAERYPPAPPRLTLGLSTNGLQLVFLTQTNTQYAIESAAVLDGSGTNWTERTRTTGTGGNATVELPLQGGAQYFRVKASDSP